MTSRKQAIAIGLSEAREKGARGAEKAQATVGKASRLPGPSCRSPTVLALPRGDGVPRRASNVPAHRTPAGVESRRALVSFPTLEAHAGAPIRRWQHRPSFLLNGEQIYPVARRAPSGPPRRRSRTRSASSRTGSWPGRSRRGAGRALPRRASGAHVLLDGVGTLSMPRPSTPTSTKRSGCEVVSFARSGHWALPARTTTAITGASSVVDGRVGFTGGSGVSRKWMGNGRTVHHWRDTDVRVEGPAVEWLQGAFAENSGRGHRKGPGRRGPLPGPDAPPRGGCTPRSSRECPLGRAATPCKQRPSLPGSVVGPAAPIRITKPVRAAGRADDRDAGPGGGPVASRSASSSARRPATTRPRATRGAGSSGKLLGCTGNPDPRVPRRTSPPRQDHRHRRIWATRGQHEPSTTASFRLNDESHPRRPTTGSSPPSWRRRLPGGSRASLPSGSEPEAWTRPERARDACSSCWPSPSRATSACPRRLGSARKRRAERGRRPTREWSGRDSGPRLGILDAALAGLPQEGDPGAPGRAQRSSRTFPSAWAREQAARDVLEELDRLLGADVVRMARLEQQSPQI